MTRFVGSSGMKSIGIETSRGTKTIRPNRDGTFTVNDPKLAKKLKAEGLGVVGIAPVTKESLLGGYDCKKCGFGSFFKKCSRCGELNG
jgi:hypothetical protein